MNDYHHIVSCNQEISEKAENVLQNGQICLTLGGDHSIAIGTVDAHVKAKKRYLRSLDRCTCRFKHK